MKNKFFKGLALLLSIFSILALITYLYIIDPENNTCGENKKVSFAKTSAFSLNI